MQFQLHTILHWTEFIFKHCTKPFSRRRFFIKLSQLLTAYLVCCKVGLQVFSVIQENLKGLIAVAFYFQFVVCFIFDNCSKESIVTFSQPIFDFPYPSFCDFNIKTTCLQVQAILIIHFGSQTPLRNKSFRQFFCGKMTPPGQTKESCIVWDIFLRGN